MVRTKLCRITTTNQEIEVTKTVFKIRIHYRDNKGIRNKSFEKLVKFSIHR
jgi:hypothetical protein